MKNLSYEYWLCSIPGIGNRTIEKLLACFESAEEIFAAKEKHLSEILTKSQFVELQKRKEEWNPEEMERLKERGIGFLVQGCDNYPKRLKRIPDAPYGIFYMGKLPGEELSVAVIGARDCSEYGSYVARELGKILGSNGVQVISGMARGIDGISQEAALSVGGSTTAVLGSGVDVCYPRQNHALYQKILEKGCVLSTYPPGTLPRAQNFPPRNRIVSGLADVVVVIEARNKSGTLITVDMALEQGKEVYVVPGRITDRLSDGCNRLLKQGAGILLSPTEFLEEIRQAETRMPEVVQRKTEMQTRLPEELQEIFELLDFMPKSAEEIMTLLPEKTDISQLNVQLMKLCLMNLAVQESPGHFGRKAI